MGEIRFKDKTEVTSRDRWRDGNVPEGYGGVTELGTPLMSAY